ncbi:uncharacterized protein LOC133899707 [Phragmites australis]|uniref:uncharacterized protein LOC133899707 n=1 Tax=Phragmites australis TaxID=29695 RepID=UPI002D79B1D2|nr:uncharacterized protein LOC133899707 [Phragmites australis]
MAGADSFLSDVNDPWLKPRLLRAVVAEQLPQLGGAELPPTEVASVLEVVRTHDLLTRASRTLSSLRRGVPPSTPGSSGSTRSWRATREWGWMAVSLSSIHIQ